MNVYLLYEGSEMCFVFSTKEKASEAAKAHWKEEIVIDENDQIMQEGKIVGSIDCEHVN